MVMRCFFTRDGHFAGVEILPDGPRADAIRQAETLFKQRAEAERFDGFEVWEGDHVIHRASGPSATPPRRPGGNLILLGLVAWSAQNAL